MKFFSRSDAPPTHDYRVLHKSFEEQIQAGKDYNQHLQKIISDLPGQTRAFAIAPWYHDPKSHDCPHDAWLMDLGLEAKTVRDEDRAMNLTMTLLGAYHDRILTFKYTNVTECNFEILKTGTQNVGDWLNDELDIVERGFVSHEILWQFGKPWKIISEFVEFSGKDRP